MKNRNKFDVSLIMLNNSHHSKSLMVLLAYYYGNTEENQSTKTGRLGVAYTCPSRFSAWRVLFYDSQYEPCMPYVSLCVTVVTPW